MVFIFIINVMIEIMMALILNVLMMNLMSLNPYLQIYDDDRWGRVLFDLQIYDDDDIGEARSLVGLQS